MNGLPIQTFDDKHNKWKKKVTNEQMRKCGYKYSNLDNLPEFCQTTWYLLDLLNKEIVDGSPWPLHILLTKSTCVLPFKTAILLLRKETIDEDI